MESGTSSQLIKWCPSIIHQFLVKQELEFLLTGLTVPLFALTVPALLVVNPELWVECQKTNPMVFPIIR
jgi:hypothetical protein